MKKFLLALAGAVLSFCASATSTTVKATQLTIPGSTVVDGCTIDIDRYNGNTAPALNGETLRLYAKNSFTLSCSGIKKIQFNLNATTGAARYTEFTPSVGEILPVQAAGDSIIVWQGDASSVTFTVGNDATLGTDGESKRGQIHILSFGVEADGVEVSEEPVDPTPEKGTTDAPYSVEEIIDLQNEGQLPTEVWSYGYIVGVVEGVSISDGSKFTADGVSTASNILLASTPDCTDYTLCVPVQLPTGDVRQALNLVDNPGNLGRDVLLKGSFSKYFGVPGLKTVTEYELLGTETPEEPVDPTPVLGSLENPYDVAGVIALNPSSTTTAVASGVYVGGYIVGVVDGMSISSDCKFTAEGVTVSTNILLADAPDCADCSQCVPVQLPAGDVRASLNLVDNPENLGKEVLVKGDLLKYFGGPGVKSVTEFEFVNYEIPEPEKGTEENPYTVSEALEVLATEGETGEYVFVSGVINSITEISVSFGNASYSIVDEGSSEELFIRRGLWLGGSAFTDENQMEVGGRVVVKGKLQNYMDSLPQLSSGNIIASYQAPESETPEDPFDGFVFHASDFAGDNPDDISGFHVNGFSFEFSIGMGRNVPIYHEETGAVRIYALGTLTISGGNLTSIRFVLPQDQHFDYAVFHPSVGEISPAQAVGDKYFTWVGNASEVTFTVDEYATMGDGEGGENNRGQIRFTEVIIQGTQFIAGSEATPTEIAELEYPFAQKDVNVTGYIVGAVNGNTFVDVVFGTEFLTVPSNILLADTPDCTDVSECIPVQLVANTAPRAALNLVDNPNMLGALVRLKGDVDFYFSCPGLKNVSEYTIISAEIPVPEYTEFEVATSVVSGKKYVMVADGKVAGNLGSKAYGYLPVADATLSGDFCYTEQENAYTFIAEGDAFYIKDEYGRYVYQIGTYNSFNVSSELPESGALWSVDFDTDGNAVITNLDVNKTIVYSPDYDNFASYADITGTVCPTLYGLTFTTGLETVEAESETPVEYYNLQGVRVVNPVAGLYIRRQGSNVSKVLLK